MKLKRFGLVASLGIMGVALASCNSKSSSYNSKTPYGNINLDETVATAKDSANDKTFTLKNDIYYNQLRYKGYDLVTSKITKIMYKNEIEVLNKVFENKSYNDFNTSTTKALQDLLVLTKDNERLYELNGTDLLTEYDNTTYQDGLDSIEIKNNYDFIRRDLIEKINTSISNSVLGSSDSKTIEDKKAKDINTSIIKFIADQKTKGNTFTLENLSYKLAKELNSDRNLISFDNIHDELFKDIVNDVILTQAGYLQAQNAVYQIADEEYITKYDADEETKNSTYYIFEDEDFESEYESSYYKYGTYKFIYIAFNSRKEAYDALEELSLTDNLGEIEKIEDDELRLEKAKDAYLKLYNMYYNYDQASSIDDDRFTYVVNRDKDDLNDVNGNIKTLVTDDLDRGSFLIEPRNIDSKYVMALHIDTEYDIHDEDGDQVKYDNLDKGGYTYFGEDVAESESSNESSRANEIKNDLIKRFKYKIISDNKAGYVTTNYNSNIYNATESKTKDDDLYIYDPVFEYNYYNSYKNEYDKISKSDYNKSEGKYILKFGDDTYTVEDFYSDASKKYGVDIINNYFELEYAYTFYDEYIDSDDHDDAVDNLDDEIDNFKDGDDKSYSKSIGLSNFLLLKYGYTNKDDVIKYSIDASKCLSSYITETVFKDWVVKTTEGDSESYKLVDGLDTQTSGILYNLLTLGNSKYEDLMEINLSHILINLDADADGSPDDPNVFLKDMTTSEKASFYDAVETLAKAIYNEAKFLYDEYDNTYVETLKYIKTKYEQGARLEYDGSDWDDYKDYNFLLTVEDLNDIDQSSVNNFVENFKKYVQNLYKTCVNDDDIEDDYEDGIFVIYSDTYEGLLTNSDQIYIDYDESTDEMTTSLCDTEFGYHMIILNSYEKTDYLTYKESQVKTGVGNVSVLIYKDKDDTSNNINVTVATYNETTNATSANFNQFFVFYCQKGMGQSSSLDSDIYALLTDLFGDIVSKFSSNDFQTYLTLKYLNVDVVDEKLQGQLDGSLEKLGQSIYDYDDESDYKSWITDETLDWLRPYQKKN